jgi:hypothetical protein
MNCEITIKQETGSMFVLIQLYYQSFTEIGAAKIMPVLEIV